MKCSHGKSKLLYTCENIFGMGKLTVTIKKTFVSFQYSDADYSGSGGAVEGVSLQHRGFVTFQLYHTAENI